MVIKNTLKILKLLRHVSVHIGTILREQMSLPSYNNIYGSTVHVHMNVVSITAAYSGLLCVCGVLCRKRQSLLARTHNSPEYAAVILTTFIWTSTVEPYM